MRGLTDHLRRSLVNQESALEEIARIIKISTLKMDAATRRPEVIFLFLGPAGIGKSYVAARIAEYLFGSPEKLRVIDLGGFKSGADVQKLIAGEEAGSQGVLVREVENHPFSVILLENAGEAHALVLNFLSKILTRGEIVDPFGKPHFLSGIIFILSLTSIGEQKREPTIGFEKSGDTATALVIPQKIMNVLDWVDEIIQFVPLTRAHLLQIAKQRAAALKQELLSRHQCQLRVEKAVLETLSLEAERSGRYAHAVSELVERKIKMPVMDLIAGGGRRLRIAVEWKSNQIRVRSK